MKITIITVTYNSESTLRDTIFSVLNQTFQDYEYLIIDGNSSDKTIEIIKQSEPLFNGRLKWVSEPDKGLYDAMNKGIKRAQGDIIGILNSDDFFSDKNVLAEIIKVFESDKHLDAVYGDVHFVSPENLSDCTRYYSSKKFTPARLRYGFMPAHPSFYMKRSCYEKYGTYDTKFKIAADYDLMVRLFHNHNIKAKYIEKDMVTMRTGGTSTKNIKNRLITTKEDVWACRKNGLYTNICLISTKYIFKIFEFKFSIRKK